MSAFRRDLYTPAPGYDVGALARRRYTDLMIRRAGLIPGEEALVVQCGLGPLANALASRFTKCDVVATDSREDTLEVARRNAEVEEVRDRMKFRHADPADLPFRTERFFVTTMDIGLHAQEDPLAVLEELHRVTDYGGKLLLADVDFSKSRNPPENVHTDVFSDETQDAMKEQGWGKVALQKVSLLRDGGILYVLQAKRYDPEETAG